MSELNVVTAEDRTVLQLLRVWSKRPNLTACKLLPGCSWPDATKDLTLSQFLRQVTEDLVEQGTHVDIQSDFASMTYHWRRATGGLSNPNRITDDDNYLAIISLGPKVIPLILKDMRNGGAHWEVALRALTGEDPAQNLENFTVRDIRNAWLRWGVEHQYISG